MHMTSKETSEDRIAVLIPSYDRPEILELTLPRWLKASCVGKVFVVAETSSWDKLERYENVLRKYESSGKLVYRLSLGRMGSVKSRNMLLNMVTKYNYNYILMTDDDYLLSDEKCLMKMVKDLKYYEGIGAVGGKLIIASRRRDDPDFFLNLPLNLADLFTRLTGYIFLDIKHGPRFSEFLPPFFMMRRDIASKVRYDEAFSTPTGFREESDLQQQIKQMGYKLLYDPKIYVVHLAIEEGGNRPKMGIGERMYWKMRNHIVFIFKWNKSIIKRIWYALISSLILLLYRPWCFTWILRGLRDGISASKTILPQK